MEQESTRMFTCSKCTVRGTWVQFGTLHCHFFVCFLTQWAVLHLKEMKMQSTVYSGLHVYSTSVCKLTKSLASVLRQPSPVKPLCSSPPRLRHAAKCPDVGSAHMARLQNSFLFLLIGYYLYQALFPFQKKLLPSRRLAWPLSFSLLVSFLSTTHPGKFAERWLAAAN